MQAIFRLLKLAKLDPLLASGSFRDGTIFSVQWRGEEEMRGGFAGDAERSFTSHALVDAMNCIFLDDSCAGVQGLAASLEAELPVAAQWLLECDRSDAKQDALRVGWYTTCSLGARFAHCGLLTLETDIAELRLEALPHRRLTPMFDFFLAHLV